MIAWIPYLDKAELQEEINRIFTHPLWAAADM